jgi:hypothetical protein
MKRLILLFAAVVIVSGCSTTHVTGSGEFFSLSSRNVVYRDLTRPVSADNEPEQKNYAVLPAPTK